MRVITVGSATVDVVVTGLSAQLGMGDKQEVEHIGQYPGGGAINAAAMLAQHGAEVQVLAACGTDMQAQALRHGLQQVGIDVSVLQTIPDQATGVAVILVSEAGHATVYANRGANRYLQVGFCPTELEGCDMLYVSPLANEALASLAKALHSYQGTLPYVVVNPSVAHVRARDASLLGLLKRVDLLCLNAVEAQLLRGDSAEAIRADLSVPQAYALAQSVCQYSGQAVLLTLGAQGALWRCGTDSVYQPALEPTTIRSTLGAGDAFSSSFAYFYRSGVAPDQALRRASQHALDVLAEPSANHLEALRLAC